MSPAHMFRQKGMGYMAETKGFIDFKKKSSLWGRIKKNKELLILFTPCILFMIVFKLYTIVWNIIVFQDYKISDGIFHSKWVFLDNFIKLFNTPDFWILMKNTIMIGLCLLIVYPLSILFALLLSEIRNEGLKRGIQMISFMPAFLSIVVISGMAIIFLSPDQGLVNNILAIFGQKPVYFLAESRWFRFIYTFTQQWQNLGYSAIIFFAAISNVPIELYDAAEIDGCGRFKRIIHVTIPCISTTIAIMMIMMTSSVILIGFDRAFLLQNPATYDVSDVLRTYAYRVGLQQANFSFASTIGVFEAVIAFVFVSTSNYASKKITDKYLW